jgi:hypothetical protein
MCVLDRVLVSNSWEDKFDLTILVIAPRLGSDHNPLLLNTDDSLCQRPVGRGPLGGCG